VLKVLRILGVLAGALIFGLWGAYGLWSAIPTLMLFFRDGSPGVAAVSFGIPSPELLLFIAAVVVNPLLASWAKRSGGTPKRLHRLQFWMLVGALALFLGGVATMTTRPGPWTDVLLAAGGLVMNAQYLEAAALLGTYAIKES